MIDHVNNLLDLDKFALDGTKLRVDRARVRDKEFVFYGTAEISHFPERKKQLEIERFGVGSSPQLWYSSVC